MDLRTLVLDGDHQWSGEPAASEDDLAALVAATPEPLPAEYLDLLRLSDGGSAALSAYPKYVRVWSARTAIEYNQDYEVRRRLPGFVGIGDNGGPDMVGFDTRNREPYPVCCVPFAPMEWSQAMGQTPDFTTFLRQLLPIEPKTV